MMNTLELLESRQMLSGTNPAATGWPAATFPSRDFRAMIYVNQNGYALLAHQVVTSAPGLHGYQLYFDDEGPLRISTFGIAPPALALYNKPGLPAQIDAGGHLKVTVPGDKSMLYVGAKARPGSAGSTYSLRIMGPKANYIETIPVSRTLNAGSGGSDISGSCDSDFYRINLPRSGNWIFKVIPDAGLPGKRLDATMNVFDARGNPVGGSFTSVVNSGGPGVTEHWTGIGLAAGAAYYLRVDGLGDSIGGYGVSAELAQLPDVSIVASRPRVVSGGAGTRQFTVSRSDNSRLPLTIQYAVSGMAAGGKDYQKLTGFVTIPGNRLSANISIKLLGRSATGGTKIIVLTLRPIAWYNLYLHAEASMIVA